MICLCPRFSAHALLSPFCLPFCSYSVHTLFPVCRYKDRWATGVKEMRDIFAKLEAEGYSKESQQVGRVTEQFI